MTKKEQIKFIRDVAGRVGIEIINKIEAGRIPEDWDGNELRWYIVEKYSGVVVGDGHKDKRNTRYKNFKNYIYVNNL